MSNLPHVTGAVAAPVTVRLRDHSLTEDLSHLRSKVALGVRRGLGLTLDVSEVERVSSPTVAAILWARRCCAARDLPFTVTGARGRNRRILHSCGFPGADRGRR